jgi:hypothetical protein
LLALCFGNGFARKPADYFVYETICRFQAKIARSNQPTGVDSDPLP